VIVGDDLGVTLILNVVDYLLGLYITSLDDWLFNNFLSCSGGGGGSGGVFGTVGRAVGRAVFSGLGRAVFSSVFGGVGRAVFSSVFGGVGSRLDMNLDGWSADVWSYYVNLAAGEWSKAVDGGGVLSGGVLSSGRLVHLDGSLSLFVEVVSLVVMMMMSVMVLAVMVLSVVMFSMMMFSMMFDMTMSFGRMSSSSEG